MEPIQARAAAALVLLQLSLLVGSGIVRVAQASLPPVHCSDDGCTIANAWGLWADRQNCKCHQVVYPTREQELVAAVATAVRTKTKLKVISRWSHSAPKLVCPAGDHGTLISTRDFNRTVHVDAKAGTVTVDAGVMLNVRSWDTFMSSHFIFSLVFRILKGVPNIVHYRLCEFIHLCSCCLEGAWPAQTGCSAHLMPVEASWVV